ncbi:uncharacterized protein LOC144060000 isoform X2 [Vanacampus margaritifer]
MYAVVNKPKKTHSPPENRTLQSSHHYDNDPSPAAAPLYSMVEPLEGAVSSARTAKRTAGLAGLVVSAGAEQVAGTHNDYNDLSTSVTDMNDGLEFNYRVQKPKGPRPPPAGWI